MFCTNCGSQINDNLRFCPNCGAIVSGEKQNVTAASTYVGPMGNPTPVLVWGILGLAFSCAFFTSVLVIIFSCIGLRKANDYISFTQGAYSKQATIGRNLSKAGLIVGIIMTVLLVIYICVIAGLIADGAFTSVKYYY